MGWARLAGLSRGGCRMEKVKVEGGGRGEMMMRGLMKNGDERVENSKSVLRLD